MALGDTLFVSAAGRDDGDEIVEQSERKVSIDDAAFAFTTTCDALTQWDDEALSDDAKAAIARLHEDAISLGYRIVKFEPLKGSMAAGASASQYRACPHPSQNPYLPPTANSQHWDLPMTGAWPKRLAASAAQL